MTNPEALALVAKAAEMLAEAHAALKVNEDAAEAAGHNHEANVLTEIGCTLAPFLRVHASLDYAPKALAAAEETKLKMAARAAA